MGRTPDAPITKEIKPTAAIAWKRVAYGEIKKRGKPVQLYDCPPSRGLKLKNTLPLTMNNFAKPINKTLKSVFIDTGENGLFSRGEFEAITTPGQMEFVTPEEIAEDTIYEIKGGNTGHDIINALDNGPCVTKIIPTIFIHLKFVLFKITKISHYILYNIVIIHDCKYIYYDFLKTFLM